MSRDDNYKPLEFDAIRIGICSPDKILKESHGEVKRPGTMQNQAWWSTFMDRLDKDRNKYLRK